MDRLPRPPIWRRYLRFWRPDVAADVDEELTFHLESRAEELIAGGISGEAAMAQALAEMGELSGVRERLTTIDARVLRKRSSLEWWRVLGGEIRFALRRLRATPGFTIAATLTMVIAIGATASVFGLVDGVLLKAFPLADPGRVLDIWESNPSRGLPQFPVSPADYLDFRAQNSAFTGLAAEHYVEMMAVGQEEPEHLTALAVTPSYFPVLGLTPMLGRPLGADSAGPPEVVISYGYWFERFGGSTSAVGAKITLDEAVKVGGEQPKGRRTYTIVGVMPAGLPGDTALWTRLSFTGRDQIDRRSHYLLVHGRLKAGRSPESGRRELNAIAQRLARTYPQTNADWSVATLPLLDELVGKVRPALLMLLSAAACVLLIGAANLANLFLVRFLAREREMALRTALGATRGRLARELIVEAAVLGAAAGAAGVVAAVAGVRVLRAFAPATLPRLNQVGVDARVIGVCVLVSIVTVILFGVLPAWRVSHGELEGTLKEGGRGTGSTEQHRLQNGLVVIQVAVAVVLLTSASLLVAGFEHFEHMNPGFATSGVLTALIELPAGRYPTPDRQDLFMARVVEQVAVLPGVRHASVSDVLPGAGVGWHFPFAIIGDPPPARGNIPSADLVCISADYFHTMGIPLVRGRGVLPTDARRSQQIVVADELLARRFFRGRDPVDRRLSIGPDTVLVVGLVAPVKQHGLATDDQPQLYAPLAQCYPGGFAWVAVRTAGEPEAQAPGIRRVVATLDKTVPVSDIKTLDAVVAESVGTTRFSSFLASLFALIAVVLGLVGIYSVLAYVVAQREREIAVRIALGAPRTAIMAAVVRQALILTTTGIPLGSVGAWIVTRALAGLFIGVAPHDPYVFAGAIAGFALAALFAASVPAFGTTRIDPVTALAST